MSDEVTEQDAQELLRQFSEGKQNVHSFFTNIIQSDDTLKTGNLTQEELGIPKLPVRTHKELALFCSDVYGDDSWASYFNKLSEIQTSSSLSKEGFLVKHSVTMKKELADMNPKERKKNKGWFKGKSQEGSQQQE